MTRIRRDRWKIKNAKDIFEIIFDRPLIGPKQVQITPVERKFVNTDYLIDLITGGEDSFTQFKENLQDAQRLAEEFVAFSNAEGGN